MNNDVGIRQPWFLKSGLRIILVLALLFSCQLSLGSASPATLDPIPLLAYYYIWFDTKSWERAKLDFPLMGRYSSDDPSVMLQHIKWAKMAGIDGFIVSWKSTEKLDSRLDQLVELADQENFKLVIIYEGLDFDRNPLPITKVDADFNYFLEKYADQTVFNLFQKPLIIWSGTWMYSHADIQRVTENKRDRLFILASEKNVEGYSRVADITDGDAYYWSSVNPSTHSGYLEKLISMGEAVHENGGLWIAPAAPGYNSTLLGGTTIVERKEGETLIKELNTAFQSAPDAIGLISWNEFSENSHMEPSINFGNRYLQVLTDFHNTAVPLTGDFDSNLPGETLNGIGVSRMIAIGLLVTLIFTALVMIIRRDYRSGTGVTRNENNPS
jgi:hypothetical protein